MEAICIKLDDAIAKKMDTLMKEHHYSTRSDFVREAIRDKMHELDVQKVAVLLKKYQGSAKRHVTEEEYERVREEVARELAKKHGVDLD